jgi:hypothetical protein
MAKESPVQRTPWFESNLLWGPLTLGGAILFTVVPTVKHDLWWIVWFAWPCFAVVIWWLSRRTREVFLISVLGNVLTGCGLLCLSNSLRPELIAVGTPQPQQVLSSSVTPLDHPATQSRKRSKPPISRIEETPPRTQPSSPQTQLDAHVQAVPQQVFNAPGGINIGGGIVDHPTVINNGPPPLQIQWKSETIESTMVGQPFAKTVTISANEEWLPVSLRIYCDQEIKTVALRGTGTLKNGGAGVSMHNNKVAFFYNEEPLMPNMHFELGIYSDKDFNVLDVRSEHFVIK